MDEADLNVAAVAGSAGLSPALAADQRIRTTLLALARRIRTPRAYVGYSAFILMALRWTCRPYAWEGSQPVDLLGTFAPWAKEHCTQEISVAAIPCRLRAETGGRVACLPISEASPLSATNHFVAGMPIPGAAVPECTDNFDLFYAHHGLATLATICDGDCAIEVMTLMLGMPLNAASRNDLRRDISDYLLSRIGDPWMQEVMALCGELKRDDVQLARGVQDAVAPAAPPAAAAEPVEEAVVPQEAAAPDEETMKAMRWASHLPDDASVLRMIRSLPKEIVEEQVRAYRRGETAVAERGKAASAERIKIRCASAPSYAQRMLVAQRFHTYCRSRGIEPNMRMPHGAIQSFIKDHLEWKLNHRANRSRLIRAWYRTWGASECRVAAADATVEPGRVAAEKDLLRSRAKKNLCARQRGPGGGRHFAVPLVRTGLYEWWSSIRYAIDWTQLAANHRSRGRKYLARFPKAVLIAKAHQLLEDYTYACLLNGTPAPSVNLDDGWWFSRWKQEHGLSMRRANRKYHVARHVQKERLEIFWVNLFRIRLFILEKFGYDPLIINWDQSPFHHNETGSQDKPTLGIRGSTVPVVEGHSDCKSRWTANLTTVSRFAAVAGGTMPFAECMFKAERDGRVDKRLQECLRSRGFPSWFTATVAPKGSYREQDVISFLDKHLEQWTEGRDWRILLADDHAPHRSENVWRLCWSRGYILLIHGGGVTPVAQTCDTDLNEHVRRGYGNRESRLLIEKMRRGDKVPSLTHEECMLMMLEVLSDPEVHAKASAGFKKVGQSIDLRGGEDALVCREAGTFWNERTTDNHLTMRPKLNAELAAVAGELSAGGITWCQRDVRRLITPYPPRPHTDRILERLGDDFYHDDVHGLPDADEDAAVTDGDEGREEPATSSDEDSEDDAGHVGAAVAGDAAEVGDAPAAAATVAAPLSGPQADRVHQSASTIAALEHTISSLKAIGSLRGAHCVELELHKEKRRARTLVAESPAVADAFAALRRAEHQEDLMMRRQDAEQKERKRAAVQALTERDAAVAELKKARKAIQDAEGIRECRHAVKTFTLEALGHGSPDAGGAKARKNRHEVLERLSRVNAGLSAGQRNDWDWFKAAWDQAMVNQHGASWPSLFSTWVQNVLNDGRSNAFSTFVYDETRRVFDGASALHVPGC